MPPPRAALRALTRLALPRRQPRLPQTARTLTTCPRPLASRPPRTHDRGPTSTESTQTDFGSMDVLGGTPAPVTGIDATTADGFALNSGLRVTGSGVLLVAGEVFRWRPWVRAPRGEGEGVGGEAKDKGKDKGAGVSDMRSPKGLWEVDEAAWGVLRVVWPKPDLLILGTGPSVIPLSPRTRKHINDLGIRVEVQDTRNAAAQFNLLATERGVQQVAAALVPVGWGARGGV
ncbi:uncharacterized protein K452DRAFT_285236 [Aplosporella prunicola CBS 121167]|uniref:NADH dehydrogenase [ubiquinone] 1 alpha subcomplex assembly factor 3 n=1 Tax=Aplosporella prunicola CBS 121167 TaxID=1176127 RepID=A0A6A6BIR0_9PEZI|nr:uncharacterized protein K452DRAFT_285236 [Aplosporella prunicola CBS 121167]KAF2144030.1 hypothetical protein K452DRAFT_285236 [Aplosporella prunicola CBS 121167]